MSHSQSHPITRQRLAGFTLVELLIVIVVIAILAAISVVAYNGIQTRAHNTVLQSDLRNASTQLELDNATDGIYPLGPTVPANLKTSANNAFQYTSDGTSYCITVTSSTSGTNTYHIDSANGGTIQEGACAGHIASGGSGPSNWSMLAGGDYFTCGIKDDTAYCWGKNNLGQLGNGTTTDSSTPVAVNTSIMSGAVTSISTGYDHACALTNSGAFCWGRNTYGALGNGTTTNASSPVAINSGAMSGTVNDIQAGSYHTCARTTNGVYCWGYNSDGQLGNGTTSNSSNPTAISTGALSGTITQLSVGDLHNCALTTNGTYCWGYNGFGELGNGTTITSTVPVAVNTGAISGSVSRVIAGGGHTCALASGNAYCWGSNEFGGLGNGNETNSTSPVLFGSGGIPGTVTGIAANGFHTCVTTGDNTYCAGYGSNGQLGDGSQAVAASTPVQVSAGALSGTVTSIASGGYHSCAITSVGAYCWGNNSNGQLGAGSGAANFTVPTAISTTP